MDHINVLLTVLKVHISYTRLESGVKAKFSHDTFGTCELEGRGKKHCKELYWEYLTTKYNKRSVSDTTREKIAKVYPESIGLLPIPQQRKIVRLMVECAEPYRSKLDSDVWSLNYDNAIFKVCKASRAVVTVYMRPKPKRTSFQKWLQDHDAELIKAWEVDKHLIKV